MGDASLLFWQNRLLLPDAIGTGGDPQIRFLIGISLLAGRLCRRYCENPRRLSGL